jgi:hypothetical protein
MQKSAPTPKPVLLKSVLIVDQVALAIVPLDERPVSEPFAFAGRSVECEAEKVKVYLRNLFRDAIKSFNGGAEPFVRGLLSLVHGGVSQVRGGVS